MIKDICTLDQLRAKIEEATYLLVLVRQMAKMLHTLILENEIKAEDLETQKRYIQKCYNDDGGEGGAIKTDLETFERLVLHTLQTVSY